MTEEQIFLAGTILKILRLANSPGMDRIAIALNCGLTYSEEQQAKKWAAAFELAIKGGKPFDLAIELHNMFPRD